MFGFRDKVSLISFLLTGLLLLMFAAFTMAAEDALPSSVQSHVRRINTLLDQADVAIEADRLTTAERKVQEADKAHQELLRRYGGKFAEDHPDYTAMVDRLKVTGEKLGVAAGAAAASEEEAAKLKAENEALCQQWIEKLGPFVDRKSEKYLRIGSDLNGATETEQAKCWAAFAEAKPLMAEYEKVQFPQGKNLALKNIESSLASTMKYYQQDEDRTRQEQASAEWVAKLSPYVEFGPGNDKVLIASVTVNPDEIKQRQAIYDEAKALYDDYLKAEFSAGKSWKLEQLEKELAQRLEAFPAAMAESLEMVSGDIGKRLDGMHGYLNRDTSWQDDLTKKPVTVMERDLKPLREEVQRLTDSGSVDETKLAELKEKLQDIEKLNQEHARIRSERTYQSPDAFTGPELEALKAKAVEVVQAEYKDVQVLRTTVPSKTWAVEDVIEATDTTNTAIRRRITRSVRAQLAIKRSDGKVYLQEVYLGQDKQPEGWGELKGHTTWRDWMQEANVNQNAPV